MLPGTEWNINDPMVIGFGGLAARYKVVDLNPRFLADLGVD